MGTATGGAFVVTWAQTTIDGHETPQRSDLVMGAQWRWTGEAVFAGHVDDRFDLEMDENGAPGGRHARIRDLVQSATGQAIMDPDGASADVVNGTLILTDGTDSFSATLFETDSVEAPLVVFSGTLPPCGQKLWIVFAPRLPRSCYSGRQNVICFTPKTRIATPSGNRAVTELREGDMVLTRDGGPQPIRWIGQRRMSGARLHLIPHLRPVRFRAGALGIERPEHELLVSPSHRMLIANRAVTAVFKTAEVLVSARDLVNGSTICVEDGLREVTYIHLLLEDHHVLWANGVECESYEPGNAGPDTLDARDLARLREIVPDASAYGPLARRTLTRTEADILRGKAA